MIWLFSAEIVQWLVKFSSPLIKRKLWKTRRMEPQEPFLCRIVSPVSTSCRSWWSHQSQGTHSKKTTPIRALCVISLDWLVTTKIRKLISWQQLMGIHNKYNWFYNMKLWYVILSKSTVKLVVITYQWAKKSSTKYKICWISAIKKAVGYQLPVFCRLSIGHWPELHGVQQGCSMLALAGENTSGFHPLLLLIQTWDSWWLQLTYEVETKNRRVSAL